MPRHAKNSSSFPHFTAAEYDKVRDRWGTKKARVGGDSIRRFDQCSLCLSTVQSPVICKKGHLFCKECVYTSILEQKAGIAAYKKSVASLVAQQDEEREQARAQARHKVLEDFEKGIGFGHLASSSAIGPALSDNSTTADSSLQQREGGTSPGSSLPTSGTEHTRKPGSSSSSTLSMLPIRAQAVARAAEEHALAEIEEGLRKQRKAKLPSFWLPSLTPSERQGQVDLHQMTEGMEVRCRVGSERGHPLNMKTLREVQFTISRAGTKECPTCASQFSNNTLLYVMRSCCGKVLCARCYKELVTKPLAASQAPPIECPCCGAAKIKDLSVDVVALHHEGTGYAGGGGMAEVKGKGRSFQG